MTLDTPEQVAEFIVPMCMRNGRTAAGSITPLARADGVRDPLVRIPPEPDPHSSP